MRVEAVGVVRLSIPRNEIVEVTTVEPQVAAMRNTDGRHNATSPPVSKGVVGHPEIARGIFRSE